MRTEALYRSMPWLIATAFAYALQAKIALTFYSSNGLVSVFWPGAGIALAAVLLGGREFAAAIYVGALGGQLWAGESLGVAAAIAGGSALEPLLGAWLLARKGDFTVSLSSSRDFFRLCCLAGALSPAVSAMISGAALLGSQRIAPGDFWHEATHCWMGATLGIIVMAPLLLTWRRLPPKPWKLAETSLVVGISILLGQIAFLDWLHPALGSYGRSYWMYLVVAWAAVRLGPHTALLLVLTAILQLLTGVALGKGPFAEDLGTTHLINAWVFTVTLATVGSALAIAFAERERVLKQLQSSESRYGSLFENMLDSLGHCRMIFHKGVPVDYEFIAVNPAFEQTTGLAGVAGRKISDVIPGYRQDNAAVLEAFGRVARTGKPERFEHYLAAVGRWLSHAVYCPFPGEFIVISEDISDRKRTESDLRKLSLAVEQSPASIVITDLEGRIEYVNPAFTLASGYTAVEAVGRNPRILKSGHTPDATYDDLWATLVEGKVWCGEFVNRRKDRSMYVETATISPLRQPDGRVSHYVGVKTDITQLRQAIADLEASENRLQLAKSAAGLAIFDRDIVSGKYTWDQRAREFWGVPPNEPVTFATFMNGLHPDDRPATRAALERALRPDSGGQYSAEYRVINRIDGSVRHIAANGQVFFQNDRAIRLVGTMKDITAKKKLEKELLERRSEMEQLVHQQVAAQTAAAIAHELNQPLVSVSAYSEAALRMLRSGVKNPDKLQRALEGAMEQSQRAGHTLHELLDFLRYGDASAEKIDANELVHEALAIAGESGYNDFRPVIDLAPDLPPVRANRLQLQKVLVNLLHNSVDAMRDTPGLAATIRISTALRGDSVQVTVHDNGPGLDSETACHVFDPFFTTKANGIGLGLAISRALIKAHGGQLWVDAENESGAMFHFSLPIAS
jgi:nitrogen fixation negative regulator NifL